MGVKSQPIATGRQPNGRRDRDLLAGPALLHRLRCPAARRPGAADQRGHQQAAFVHQNQARATPSGLPLDARPVLGQPARQRGLVTLAGDATRQLRRVTPVPQPGTQVVRMEADAELLFDEQSQTPGGPQFRGKAVLGGVVGQPPPDDLLLRGCELGWAPGNRSCQQPRNTVVAERRHPSADTAGVNTEEVGNLLGAVLLLDAPDGENPASLQLSG